MYGSGTMYHYHLFLDLYKDFNKKLTLMNDKALFRVLCILAYLAIILSLGLLLSSCEPSYDVSMAFDWLSLAPVAGSVISGLFGKKNTDSNNKTQIDLMHEQNAFNKEMWDLNNQYNDPSAWKQRMLDAGLNPSSYSQNMTNAPTASTTAVTESAPVPDFGSSLAQSYNNYLQSKQVEASTKVAEATARKTNAEAMDMENTVKSRDGSKWYDDIAVAEIKQRKAELRKTMIDTLATDANRQQVIKMTDVLVNKSKAEVEQILQATLSIMQQMHIDKVRLSQDVKESNSRIAQNYQQTQNMRDENSHLNSVVRAFERKHNVPFQSDYLNLLAKQAVDNPNVVFDIAESFGINLFKKNLGNIEGLFNGSTFGKLRSSGSW